MLLFRYTDDSTGGSDFIKGATGVREQGQGSGFASHEHYQTGAEGPVHASLPHLKEFA